MKQVYIIHGWGGSRNSEGWFGWLKQELEAKNVRIEFLEMPDTNYPRIETWVRHLENNVKELDEETYFIGHSIGCQAIMRFLEKLPENIKIGGCVFVAGFFNLTVSCLEIEEDKEIAEPWLETSMNTEKIKEHAKNFLAIFSEDDPDIPLSDSDIFKEKLNAEIVIKKDEGHFNNTEKIPEVLDFILK